MFASKQADVPNLYDFFCLFVCFQLFIQLFIPITSTHIRGTDLYYLQCIDHCCNLFVKCTVKTNPPKQNTELIINKVITFSRRRSVLSGLFTIASSHCP